MLFRKKRHEIISEITVTPTPIIMKTKDKIKNIKPISITKIGLVSIVFILCLHEFLALNSKKKS